MLLGGNVAKLCSQGTEDTKHVECTFSGYVRSLKENIVCVCVCVCHLIAILNHLTDFYENLYGCYPVEDTWTPHFAV